MVLDVLHVLVCACVQREREREERRQRGTTGMGAVGFLFRVPKSNTFLPFFKAVVAHRIERMFSSVCCVLICVRGKREIAADTL